jgi:hypothetical protein
MRIYLLRTYNLVASKAIGVFSTRSEFSCVIRFIREILPFSSQQNSQEHYNPNLLLMRLDDKRWTLIDTPYLCLAVILIFWTFISGHWVLDSDYELSLYNLFEYPHHSAVEAMTTFLVTHLSLICQFLPNAQWGVSTLAIHSHCLLYSSRPPAVNIPLCSYSRLCPINTDSKRPSSFFPVAAKNAINAINSNRNNISGSSNRQSNSF